MAVTWIGVIKGSSISRAIDYVANPDKTNEDVFHSINMEQSIEYALNPSKDVQRLYRTAINCSSVENVYSEMMATKQRFGKTEGGALGFHVVQSFKPGEIEPELAHKLGCELARRCFGKYEAIVGTHLDKAHIHNHIIINSVSFVDGRKYHSHAGSYYHEIRKISDELCREYGLSIVQKGFLPGLVVVLAFTAGSAMVMWLGEQISEFGIGNGISMILFANIVSGLPSMVGTLFTLVWWEVIIVLVGMAALILFIIFINDAERRIPIQYAKRVVGRKIYGGQNTNLPIKVSMSGVLPVIFAQSICSLPATICAFTGNTSGWWYENVWSASSWIYAVTYFFMIFFFSWFYSTIQYDPVEIANNLKKNGGFIPGFRPGKPTADFIQKVINKIVVFGAIYLGIVALLPIVAGNLMAGVRNLAIGGTSVIIVVGVALETVKALEAQMLMRHYKGFLD